MKKGNLSNFILEQGYFSKANNGGILGIAKDGHLLVGPYNDDGELWSCQEHDICNGTTDANGNYVYVATGTFPYHLGCWGPAAMQEYKADCSKSGCGGGVGGGSGGDSGAITLIANFTAITATFLYLF